MSFLERMEKNRGSRAGFSLIEAVCMMLALVLFTFLLAGVTKPYWAGKETDVPQKSPPSAATPPVAAPKK